MEALSLIFSRVHNPVELSTKNLLDEVDLAELRRTIEYTCNTDRVALDFLDEHSIGGQRTVEFAVVKLITGFEIGEEGIEYSPNRITERISVTLPDHASSKEFARQFNSHIKSLQ